MASLDTKYMRHFPEGVKFQHTVFRKRSHNGKLGESVYPKFSQKSLCPKEGLSVYLDKTKEWRNETPDNMLPQPYAPRFVLLLVSLYFLILVITIFSLVSILSY